ncbi:MAG: phenylacetate-CoA oxygenase subunit PaaC [Chitinophagaceae bacterium]|nr:phenylacetate-CoA oxygenase subunit PaaC [Chitinophagaceae bacterium]
MYNPDQILSNNSGSKVPPLEGFREAYILHLADTTLILSQRNSEWCGHGPVLEQDIAITNISLDLLGQSRNFYQYAAQLINDSNRVGGEVTEDKLAYLRKEREFKNLLLVEQQNGDWGQTILRQYLFSQYQYLLFEKLQQSSDEQLAAIAAKSLKETKYHVRWSSEWVIRLGDGTEESHSRMQQAITELWPYTGEMFEPADYEIAFGIDLLSIKNSWDEKVKNIFDEAMLPIPPLGGGGAVFMQSGGKEGRHTEQLGYIITELQYMQRTYPDSEW